LTGLPSYEAFLAHVHPNDRDDPPPVTVGP
jgi:hypothetical protein